MPLLLELPVEVWDRVLFWMSLAPRDVANFAKASRRCHFLAFGPVGDRNEYNLLQHGGLLGGLLVEEAVDNDRESMYFKYLYDTDHVDRALFAILRMSSRASAASVLEASFNGLLVDEPYEFDGETLYSLLCAGRFTPWTWTLLRRIGEAFGPADFTKREVIYMVGALSGVRYEGMPRKSAWSAAKFAIIGGHPELLTQLLDEITVFEVRAGCLDFLQTAVRLERYKCFEVAFEYIVFYFGTSCRPQDILAPIIESLDTGLRAIPNVDSFPFYSLVFKAIAEKRLDCNPHSMGCHWGWLKSPFLESPRAAELMASVAESWSLRRMLRSILSPSSAVQVREKLPIIELMVDAGIRLPFNTIAKTIGFAQSEALAKIVFRAEVLDFEQYPRWFSKTILFPVCADRDWEQLRREVEDFVEGFDQKAVGECYMALMEVAARARDVVGDDGGVEAANEIVAAFTPWLFGREATGDF